MRGRGLPVRAAERQEQIHIGTVTSIGARVIEGERQRQRVADEGIGGGVNSRVRHRREERSKIHRLRRGRGLRGLWRQKRQQER